MNVFAPIRSRIILLFSHDVSEHGGVYRLTVPLDTLTLSFCLVHAVTVCGWAVSKENVACCCNITPVLGLQRERAKRARARDKGVNVRMYERMNGCLGVWVGVRVFFSRGHLCCLVHGDALHCSARLVCSVQMAELSFWMLTNSPKRRVSRREEKEEKGVLLCFALLLFLLPLFTHTSSSYAVSGSVSV